MKNFGKLVATPETATIPGMQIGLDDDENPIYEQPRKISYVCFRTVDGLDIVEAAKLSPHAFYIAVLDDGQIVSMTDDIEQSQVAGVDIIGIDDDFGCTFGPDGNVYSKRWSGTEIVDPLSGLTAEEIRAQMPPLTPRMFRDALIDNDILPDDVTAAIQKIEDPKARAKAINAWEYPTRFDRVEPLIEQIGAIFHLTPEKIDQMWNAALNAT